MKVYIDTNIISRIIDQQVSDDIAAAYEQLAEAIDIEWLTSEVTDQELRNTTNKKKRAMLRAARRIAEKVKYIDLHTGGRFILGGATLGEVAVGALTEDHPLYIKLKQIFDPADAAHITQAVLSKCDYFLTLDKKTILSRVAQNSTVVGSLCGKLCFGDPIALCAIMERPFRCSN